MLKLARSSRSCICVPTATTPINPTSLPIPHTNILHAMYNTRTNMIQLQAVIRDQPKDVESSLDLYKFMYTVKDNERDQAIQFCQTIMDTVYRGIAINSSHSRVYNHLRFLSMYRFDSRETTVSSSKSFWRPVQS
jgi:hypothetical protein